MLVPDSVGGIAAPLLTSWLTLVIASLCISFRSVKWDDKLVIIIQLICIK